MGNRVKVLFIGGTKRALNSLEFLMACDDVELVFAIIMQGYEDEWKYAEQLGQMAKDQSVEFVITNRVDEKLIERSKNSSPDVILGGGVWRTYLPDNFLTFANYGYIGLHGSGLPAYRGWAGLTWYILNNEPVYKMRVLQLNTKYDAGPLVSDDKGNLLEYTIPLDNEKHLAELMEEAGVHTVQAMSDVIKLISSGRLRFLAQNNDEATYTCHRGAMDGEIDWKNTTKDIFNFIRGQSDPYPGAFTFWKGNKIHVWKVRTRQEFSNYVGRIEGKVVDRNMQTGSVIVLTADSAIEILEAGEVNNSRVVDIFDSVRDRCKSRTEGYLDSIGFE